MTEKDATIAVIDALNDQNIPYMLVGSFSTSFKGFLVLPRMRTS